ncbi:hypothetical protein [Eggerthella lenta]|uniref:hypothetical protein n=1 Tax=Eggerthella lenta TaxID=84112 RepID=UPI0022E415FB|nr:hypothetical protein [Eggerthella lenta]
MSVQLQEGDVVEILGEAFVVLDIQSDERIESFGDAPIHNWIEKIVLMQLRADRKAG